MKENIKTVLERPFTELKTRPGRNGQHLTYVEAHNVIARLNEAFGTTWTFRVLEHLLLDTEVVVVAELEVPTGTKQAFGGADITRPREGGDPVSIADDLKSAATDALKKAATLLGIGLHLYGIDANVPPADKNASSASRGSNGINGGNGDANRLSRRQHAYIQKLARDLGLDRSGLDQMARERFGKVAGYISMKQASSFIDTLREQQGG